MNESLDPSSEIPKRGEAPPPAGGSPLWAAIPLLLGVLVFLPALGNGFIFDDNGEMGNFDGLFTPGAWPSLFLRAQYQLYRPIKYVTLHFDHALWGMNPIGFHLTNVLLHGAVCALVWGLLRALRLSPRAALLGSLWFALHPIHTEPVVWVTARGSMLSAIGVFAAVIFYLRWSRAGRALDLVALAGSAAFAFFSKEDSLMLVPALGAFRLWGGFDMGEGSPAPNPPRPRARWLTATLVCALPAALYIVLRQRLLEGVTQGKWDHGFAGLAATLPWILARYLGQLLLPTNMVLEPRLDFAAGFGPRFWLSSLLIVALLGAAWGSPGEGRSPRRLAVAWFLLFLAPTMGFIPINAPAADRFLYIPSFAGALTVAWGWDRLARARPEALRVAGAVMAGLLLVFAALSVGYIGVWRDDLHLWNYVVELNPDSYRGWNNIAAEENKLGVGLEQSRAQTGRNPAADDEPGIHYLRGLEWAETALKLKPDYIEARVTRARSLDHLGRRPEADAEYRHAIAMNPSNTIALEVYADFLDRDNRLNEAAELYDKILALRPNSVEALNNAGVSAIRRGDRDRAALLWRKALEIEPGNRLAASNLERASLPQHHNR